MNEEAVEQVVAAHDEEPCCVLHVVELNVKELNKHLKWLHKRLKACEDALELDGGENPTAKPTVVAAKTAGWGNGNKS